MKMNQVAALLPCAAMLALPARALVIEGADAFHSLGGGEVAVVCTQSVQLVVSKAVNVEMLLVAGGGGGGDATNQSGGGGGGGGVIHEQSVNLAPGIYSVTIGAGGACGANGENSIFNGFTAIGGGGGGGTNVTHGGQAGGSGGGASGRDFWFIEGGSGTAGQGFKGGDSVVFATGRRGKSTFGVDANYAGGGGGAGAPGGNGWLAVNDNDEVIEGGGPGNGGDGYACAILGTEAYYGGGGGGGHYGWYKADWYAKGGKGGGGDGGWYGDYAHNGDPTVGRMENGKDGEPGTGGGGGGGAARDNWRTLGGVGGSGILILRYAERFYEFSEPAEGGDEVSLINGKMVHVFTNSGTLHLPRNLRCEVLVVGGGGGGGDAVWGAGGGGGGGGVVYTNDAYIFSGDIAITVGQGGTENQNGENSSIGIDYVAFGGGAGGNHDHIGGMDGGSGGGAGGINNYKFEGGAGVVGQGFKGGDCITQARNLDNAPKNNQGEDANYPGGGGGASEPGQDGWYDPDYYEEGKGDGGPGAGGAGFACSISGVEKYYGGGGGAGHIGWYRAGLNAAGGIGGGGKGGIYHDWAYDGNPENGYKEDAGNGEPCTGGGGGGGGRGNGKATLGGTGGSGIVIISYRLPQGTFMMVK